jgi:hypothetical protein
MTTKRLQDTVSQDLAQVTFGVVDYDEFDAYLQGLSGEQLDSLRAYLGDQENESELHQISRMRQKVDAQLMTKWLVGKASWRNFVTLTYSEQKGGGRGWEQHESAVHWLIDSINRYVYGPHYKRKVGKSYFSYARGVELQSERQIFHDHWVTSHPLPYRFIHRLWNAHCGFARIDQLRGSPEAALNYVLKYSLKGGETEIQLARYPERVPAFPFRWWNMAVRADQRRLEQARKIEAVRLDGEHLQSSASFQGVQLQLL